MPKLEQHHVKYEELHGEDEIVMLTRSEHKKLHMRLRRENKCDVPPKELAKISHKAHDRSLRGKAKNKQREMNRQYIEFYESFGKYTWVRESIRYNYATGSVTFATSFGATLGRILLIIEVK